MAGTTTTNVLTRTLFTYNSAIIVFAVLFALNVTRASNMMFHAPVVILLVMYDTALVVSVSVLAETVAY